MRQDLKLHCLGGALIGFVVALLVALVALPALPTESDPVIPMLLGAALAGVAAAYVVGWLKEYVYDKARPTKHTVDPMDLRYTWIGGVVGGPLGALAGSFLNGVM